MVQPDGRVPDDLPILERSAVRVVLLDADERVLLFHTRDLDHPDLETWWELPGGGIDESGRLEYELEDYFAFRWWSLPEIVASDSRFYPGRLPELVTPFLHGEHVDEPFELWS